MIEQNELEEIKELIKSGFDLKLISFELDIPIEIVKKCKEQVEKEQVSRNTKKNGDKKSYSKMEQMRERYQSLFLGRNKFEVKLPKELTQQELELIDSVINMIEEILNAMRRKSKEERKKCAYVILEKIKMIEDYQLTLEQSERLNSLMESEELSSLNLSRTDRTDSKIYRQRVEIIKKLAEAIDIAQSQTEDLEELKILGSKITIEMMRENQMTVGFVKSKIENRISKIKQQKLMERIRDDIPANILSIIEELVNGTLDIQKANRIIEEEAKKKVESKPKTKFLLTEEQEKGQILIQIRKAIIENADKYCIKNPEEMVLQLEELGNVDINQAVRVVVENLINRKDFETAKKVCRRFSIEDEYGQIGKYMTNLKKQIKNAEIGEMVLKGINMEGTDEEKGAYFETIERGLNLGNVRLGAIPLGKSQDGLRSITLADVWPGEPQQVK